MEASQAIRVPVASKSNASSITARIHQDRRRKLIGVSFTVTLISVCIWLRPHALDANVLFWVLWSRPLALAYMIFGARVGYCVVANVPFRKEPKNPFAAQSQAN